MLILTWPCHSSYADEKLRRKWQPQHALTPAAFYHLPTPTALTPHYNTDDGGDEKAGTSGRAVTREESGGKERGIWDFIREDLVRFDLGQWLSDVEKHKALSMYPLHEGGYEGRYLNKLRYQGYHFLDLSARRFGDPETTLTIVHPVCPPRVGKQRIARWYFPPEVNKRLSLLPPNDKRLVVWVIEAKEKVHVEAAQRNRRIIHK